MKRVYLFLLLSFPLLLLGQRTTRLSGKVSGQVDKIRVAYESLDIGEEGFLKEIPLEAGAFSVEMGLEQAEVVQLSVGERALEVYLEPGKNLSLNFDAGSMDSKVMFEGDLAQENNFYSLYQQIFRSDLDDNYMKQTALKTSVDMFELDLFNKQNSMKQAFAKAPGKASFTSGFNNYMEYEVGYWYDRWMIAYPILRANASEASMDVKHLPRTIEETFNANRLNQEAGLLSASYRDFIYYYITYAASRAHEFTKFKDYNKSVDFKMDAARKELRGTTLTWFLSRLIFENCEQVASGTMNKVREQVKREINGDKYYPTLETRCNQALAAKEAGGQAPATKQKDSKSGKKGEELYPFKMVDLEGKQLHLSDYKGKVVYIDFWASWCGPCRGQFPHSKRMHAELEDKLGKKGIKDIVFLYVSIDKDANAWKNAVEKFQLQGIMAHSPAQWRDGAGAFFKIPSIPRYMIMDRSGKIVNANAPRPSQAETMDLLLKLL